MSYLWTFQSFSQRKFDDFVADRTRFVETVQLEIDAEESFRRRAVDEANRREREKPLLRRLTDAALGRARPPIVHTPAWPDLQSVFDHIRIHGLNYNGLVPDQARTLDAVVEHLSYEECPVREELQMEMESPDGVHSSVLEETISRGRGCCQCRILPLLLEGGRRIGSRDGRHCEYCLLTPDEVEVARVEAECCLRSGGDWSDPGIRDVVSDCLADVFKVISEKGKAAFCSLG
jgi:hypothetical protein